MARKEKRKQMIAVVSGNASFFDGKLLGQIGTSILALFALILPLLPVGGLAVLGFTLFADLSKEILIAIYAAIGVLAFFMLFLGLAWATVVMLRWKYRHTVINGNRLVFKGKKTALWGNLLKWLFLTVITLLIYGLWVWIKAKKWVIENVETAEQKDTDITEENIFNPYLPPANPYFPTYPTYPPMPNISQAGNASQGQMPFGYFPPYPYFPPYNPYNAYNPYNPYAPYPCENAQNKKEK